MNFFVADPEWGGWIVAYFFLGGIAAGSYFIATLIDWFGRDEDRELSRIAYIIALPLLLLCTVFLIVDLNRPERFWHMMFKSEIAKRAIAEGFPYSIEGWRCAFHAPMFKYFSPMSAGSWGLAVFGGCAFLSFVVALRPHWRISHWLRARWIHGVFQLFGCIAAFFVASYTGGLLSATNQPIWSDTVWLSPLFLASAGSTSLAAMTLIAWWRNVGTRAARERLAGSEPFALVLELIVLGAFLASLGEYLFPVLLTIHGNVMIFGTLVLGILAPLLIHGRIGHRKTWGLPAAAFCALTGGLLLRYGVVELAPEMLRRGPSLMSAFAPEEHRERGEPGADPGNHAPPSDVQPRTKLPAGDDR